MFLSCHFWNFKLSFVTPLTEQYTLQAPTILTKVKTERRSAGNTVTVSGGLGKLGNTGRSTEKELSSNRDQAESTSSEVSWAHTSQEAAQPAGGQGEVRVRSLKAQEWQRPFSVSPGRTRRQRRGRCGIPDSGQSPQHGGKCLGPALKLGAALLPSQGAAKEDRKPCPT